ncbi:MAG TPA: DUF3054 domain-containing protein [Acidimicrobiia bacterium]|nr:DUF3054 domain-containing protein [Acidimicrobiia bacterium]
MKNPALLWLDVGVLLLFVVLGRRTHEEAETLSGVLRTAAPFMLALLAGWTVTSAWTRPARLPVGLGVLVATIGIGMPLRRIVFDEGTATPFVIVATLFLAAGFLGWRLGAAWLASRKTQQAASAVE